MKSPWPNVPLAEVLTERQESPTDEDLASGQVRIVAKIGFSDGQIYLRSGAQTRTGMILIRPGDLVLSGINAAKGAIAIYGQEHSGPIAATIHYGAYIPNKKCVDVQYLWWLLRSDTFRDLLREHVPGGIKTELKAKRLLPIPIPLPSLDEQRRIVARVEELAALIEEAQGLRVKAREEAEVLLLAAKNNTFDDKFRSSWPRARLGTVADIGSGVTLGRNLPEPTISLPYLRVANVQDGFFDLREIKEVDIRVSEREKWLLQPGDILLTEGGDWDKLGRGTVWHGEIPDCIHQNHIFRVRVDPSKFIPEYLSALISSQYGREYFQASSKQTTNLATINRRQLSAFEVYGPPLQEQRRIVAYLDGLQAQVYELAALQAAMQAELDALLPAVLDRAFRGELSEGSWTTTSANRASGWAW